MFGVVFKHGGFCIHTCASWPRGIDFGRTITHRNPGNSPNSRWPCRDASALDGIVVVVFINSKGKINIFCLKVLNLKGKTQFLSNYFLRVAKVPAIIIAKGNASFLVTAKGRSRENPPRTLTPWSARARTALRPSANRPGSPYGLAPQFRLGVRGDFRPRGLLFAKHVIFRLVVTAVTPLISPSQTAYLRYQGARTGPKGEKRVPGLRCSAGPGPGFSHYRAFWVLRVTGAP